MPENPTFTHALALLVFAAPLAMVFALGVTSLADQPMPERATARLIRWSILIALSAALGVLATMLATGDRHLVLDLGNWVSIHGNDTSMEQAYHFKIKLIYDRLSVPFLILSLVLCGIIGAFAVKYMHRERGYNRFFVLYSFFVLGMVLTSLAGTIETLFTGWELVGLSSASWWPTSRSGPDLSGTGYAYGSSTAYPTRPSCWPLSSCTIWLEQAISTSCLGPAPGRLAMPR